MNLFDEIVEVEEMKDRIKELQDKILDLYPKNKDELKDLLITLNNIESEIDSVNAEMQQMIKDGY